MPSPTPRVLPTTTTLEVVSGGPELHPGDPITLHVTVYPAPPDDPEGVFLVPHPSGTSGATTVALVDGWHLTIESLVLVFRYSHEAPENMTYAAFVGLSAAGLMIAWGVFIWLNRSAEELEPEAMRHYVRLSRLNHSIDIGATTAMFGVIYAFLLRPLPYSDPKSLVMLQSPRHEARTYGRFRRWHRACSSV